MHINGKDGLTENYLTDNNYKFTAASSDTATESVDGGGVRVVISGQPPTTQWDEKVFRILDENGYSHVRWVRIHIWQTCWKLVFY